MDSELPRHKTKSSSFLDRVRTNEVVTGLTLSIIVGAVAGLGAVGFRWLVSEVQTLFFSNGATYLDFMGPYYIILIPAVGGLIVGLLVRFGAREAKGHGVPEVMEAVTMRGGRIRPRVSIIKALASSICIGSGGSVGREGPIVQIGSSFGSTIGQWLGLSDDWVRTLLACGAAGGISATFNTPIGGVFFAMEVILGRFVTPKFGYVVISSVVADFVAHIFLGSQPSFGIVSYEMASYWETISYAMLGVAAALAATVFIRVLYKLEDIFDAWHIPEFLKPAIGGLCIGLIGLYSYDLFGVGYGNVFWVSKMSVDQALLGQIALPALAILLLLKITATSLTLGSGGSGGIFAPSLFIGAMLGGALGSVAHLLFPAYIAPSGAYALVGMAAVFAGATRAPFTAIIMLFEMTRNYSIILPLMIAVVISVVISKVLNRETIYTLKLVRRGVDLRQLNKASPLREVTVEEAMTWDFPTVPPTMLVRDLVVRLRRTGHHGFPVVNEKEEFVGVVTIADVEAALTQASPSDLAVRDIVSKSVVVAYPDEYIHDVLVKLGSRDVGRIPVVDRGNPKHLLGVLRRHDVLTAYSKSITRKPRR
ncbi:MAG TPA: chloride channel protein [Dehalococcoidales bacterium]|nr:chloride channel protein [Dehalococcoidales bacterium]